MDAALEKLKARIEKLRAQQQEMEEKYVNAVACLVRDLTTTGATIGATKGLDLSTLTGMILNASDIIVRLPGNKEVWQAAGEKFLFKAKNQHAHQRRTVPKN